MGDDHVANPPAPVLPPPRLGRDVLDSPGISRLAADVNVGHDCDRRLRGDREEDRGQQGERRASELEAAYGPQEREQTADGVAGARAEG